MNSSDLVNVKLSNNNTMSLIQKSDKKRKTSLRLGAQKLDAKSFNDIAFQEKCTIPVIDCFRMNTDVNDAHKLLLSTKSLFVPKVPTNIQENIDTSTNISNSISNSSSPLTDKCSKVYDEDIKMQKQILIDRILRRIKTNEEVMKENSDMSKDYFLRKLELLRVPGVSAKQIPDDRLTTQQVSKHLRAGNYSMSDEARKKFASAKSISSDQFFDNSDRGGAENKPLAVEIFGNCSGISSDMYFNRDMSGRYDSMDIYEVKESVKQGISKVANKLGSIATGAFNNIQSDVPTY